MVRQLKKYFKISTCLRIALIIFLSQLLLYLLKYKQEAYTENSPEGLHVNLITEKAVPLNFSNPSEGSWQYVSGITAFKFLVFSAYLDIREKRLIRVIAATRVQRKRDPLPQVWCKLWYKEGYRDGHAKTVSGTYQIIKEHWTLPYSAYYITCLIDNDDPVPEAISVVSAPEQTPENLLKVIVNYDENAKWNPSELSPLIDKMAVCVKPLHYDYNRVMEILEFIELHWIMGADHFFLYNHTVGPQVGCILKKYQSEGTVTILPWQLPIESQREIRTEGIFAALNDCLYRTRHKYSHSIFVDFDEFIMPTNNYTYRDLFVYLHQQYDISRQSTFSFRNAFFYRQWPDDVEVRKLNDPIAENLIVLRKTTRKTELHLHRTRSKLILRPELVNMVGNHFVWDYYNKRQFGRLEVKEKDAFLHHYRVCEFGGDDCVKQNSIVDKTAYRYKNELIKAVKTRYNKYLTECNLEKISHLKGD